MNMVRVGRVVRALRRDRGWRQVDLARRSACSQQVISLIECGRGKRVSLRSLDRVVLALDAEVDISIRWHGGQLERLMDEGHARLVGQAAARLEALGWIVRLEVTYSLGHAEGSIDILAFMPPDAALLIGEVKAEILGSESTLRKHDEKVRLGPEVAGARFGWVPRTVSRMLIVPQTSTAWRALQRHEAVFDRAYTLRGHELARWLETPTTAVSGVWFLSHTKPAGGRRELTSRRRIRVRGAAAAQSPSSSD